MQRAASFAYIGGIIYESFTQTETVSNTCGEGARAMEAWMNGEVGSTDSSASTSLSSPGSFLRSELFGMPSPAQQQEANNVTLENS